MNKFLAIGILMQIPNIFVLLILGAYFILPHLDASSVYLIIAGTIYGLINIFSIILISSGLLMKR